MFVPKVITIEEDVIDGVAIAAVRAGGIIAGVGSEASGVVSIEGMTSDELECHRLVCAGLGGENPGDEWMEG